MKKLFSKNWKSSTQRRKQRKYVHNAPLNIRHKMMSTHVADDIKKEFSKRNIPVRKGDEVKIKTGQFKGKTGKVSKVNLKRLRTFVENIGVKRADGSLSLYPIHPSNLEIIKLDRSDDKRMNKLKKGLEKKDKKEKPKKEVKEK
jgi:large subunit ribosomal protein L24